LSWTKRLITVRKSSRVFGRGSLTFIRPTNRAVLVYARQYEGETILCVANMSRSAQFAEIDLSRFRGLVPTEMLGRTRFPRIGELPYLVTLPPYGFFWFSLAEASDEGDKVTVPPEFVTLVLSTAPDTIFDWSRRTFERDVAPAFLISRRWYADKDVALRSTTIAAGFRLGGPQPTYFIGLIDTETERGTSRYVLPLTVEWKRIDQCTRPPANIIAAVRRGAREGTLFDAAAEKDFIVLMLDRLRQGAEINAGNKTLAFRPTNAFREMSPVAVEAVRPVNREQSNTTVIVDAAFVLKLYRRIKPGVHPEVEVGRFLTDVAGYAHTPALMGSVEVADEGGTAALAVVHRYVENQGDAWSVTNGYLDRYIDDQRVVAPEVSAADSELTVYQHRMRIIGRRTAELHQALACSQDDPDFVPEPITADDLTAWTERAVSSARSVFRTLARRRNEMTEANRALTDALLADPERVIATIEGLLPRDLDAMKIRHHGDFHLGQLLVAKDDVSIIDFEGEPRRSVDERRRKAPADRDVAGLIRSIDYSTTAALDRIGQVPPEEMARLAPALATWRDVSTATFLAAYRDQIGDSPLLPSDPAHADRLLRFFLMEKALYEIEYELANRPAWLHVPLAGALRILRSPEPEAATANG
jgi:maltose alpha-D-glucosyltransferase/alpha-amylase